MAAKIYVFEGPESSGKTLLAKEISDYMGYPMAVYRNARAKGFIKNPWYFRACKKTTELIVLDDLYPINTKITSITPIIQLRDAVYVNCPGEIQFKINPDIIITTTNIGLFNNTPGVEIFRFPITYLESRAIKDEILRKD